MALETNKAIFTRLCVEGFSNGRTEVVDEVVSEDIHWGGVSGLRPTISQIAGHAPGREGVKQVIRSLRTAFPDFSLTIQHLVAEGEIVIGHMFAEGSQEGTYQGFPPSGRRFKVEDVMMFRVRDGVITEFWHVPDKQSIMQQIGALDG